MKDKSRSYFIMTVFQVIVGILGIIVFAIAAINGTLTGKSYAILIIALLLVILGAADLKRIAALKKAADANLLPDEAEEFMSE